MNQDFALLARDVWSEYCRIKAEIRSLVGRLFAVLELVKA